MKAKRLVAVGSMMMPLLLSVGAKASEPATPLVRIAELEIDPAQLERYQAAVKEEIATSIREERGVLAIYSVAEKEKPSRLRFFEIYADLEAYHAHLASPHFKQYAAATKGMILSKKLVEAVPVILSAKPVAVK